MKFNASQAKLLAEGLRRYSEREAVNGLPLSWEGVVDKILMSPVSGISYPESGGPPPLRGEVLRRFEAGESRPKDNKLQAVARFLLAENVISAADLEPKGISGEALNVHGALANASQVAAQRLGQLASSYCAEREGPAGRETFELHFTAQPVATLLGAEERIAVRGVHASLADAAKARERTPPVKRKGYVIASTAHVLLNIFVSGSDGDKVQYVELESSPGSLVLRRMGVALAGDDAAPAHRAVSILRFSPTGPPIR